MIPDLRRVFELLGYYAHPVGFSAALEGELRRVLTDNHPSSQVTLILKALPDLFVLHPDMRQGIFFVRHSDGHPIPDPDADCYRRYYPKHILLTAMTPEGGKKRLTAMWFGDTKYVGLVEAIGHHFKYQPSKRTIQDLARGGWLV